MKDLRISIRMKCSVCGNDQFLFDEKIEDLPDETEVQCSDCGRMFSKGELIEENSEIINASIEDFGDEIMIQLEKDLKNIFK